MTDIPFDSGAEPVRLGRAQRRRKLGPHHRRPCRRADAAFRENDRDETTLHETVELAGIGLIYAGDTRPLLVHPLYRWAQETRNRGDGTIFDQPQSALCLFAVGIFGIGAQTGSVLLGLC